MNDSVLPFVPPVVECASCGGRNVSTSMQAQEFQWGVGRSAETISARVPVHECRDCGFVFTDEAGESARHEAVCRHLDVLTPAEVRSIRERANLSRAEFARLTQIGEASLARWEAGALIQNKALDRYLRLVTIPENLERLRRAQYDPASHAGAPRFKVIKIAEWRTRAASFQLRTAQH